MSAVELDATFFVLLDDETFPVCGGPTLAQPILWVTNKLKDGQVARIYHSEKGLIRSYERVGPCLFQRFPVT